VKLAVLDTGVYITHGERKLSDFVLTALRRAYVIRHSAVVLSELRRGASTGTGRRWVEDLSRAASQVWTPVAADWWQAGRLIQELGDARHWNTSRRRDFQNDALIALSARRHGATVITSDRADFALLGTALGISVRFV
jgi:predicted nucleic acid-binding protein